MRLAINGARLRRQIQNLPGGMAGLERRWAEIPDRATLFRWQKGATLPATSDSLLQLAAAVDLDPFALLDLGPNPAKWIVEIVRFYQNSRWTIRSLAFIGKFIGGVADWPPPDFAQEHYARDWHTRDFAYDPHQRACYYETVHLEKQNGRPGPQVFHFAYSPSAAPDSRWIHYGILVRDEEHLAMYHIRGYHAVCTYASATEASVAETWFGPEPASFRVASLHPFTLHVGAPIAADCPSVRFPG